MEEFVSNFDLTNQQVVLLNEVDIVSGNENLSDFSPVNINSDEPFADIRAPRTLEIHGHWSSKTHNSETSKRTSMHQLQIIKHRNGVRYMKFKKSKKAGKPVEQHPQQFPFLNNHENGKNEVENSNAKSCRAAFTSKVKLRKQEHAFKKKHRCPQCFEEFNVLENLTLHISLHSFDGRCPRCGKCFRRLASFHGHIKAHFKSKSITIIIILTKKVSLTKNAKI